MKYQLVTPTLLVAMSFHGSTALAHHSFAMFDSDKCREINGTFRAIEWTFPHVWIWVTVPDGAPNAGTWGFEGDSPAVVIRNGWKRDSIKLGEKVTVQFVPLRSGEKGGAFGSVKLADGKLLRGTVNAKACKLPSAPPLPLKPG